MFGVKLRQRRREAFLKGPVVSVSLKSLQLYRQFPRRLSDSVKIMILNLDISDHAVEQGHIYANGVEA